MAKRKCEVCGKGKVKGYYNKHYNTFICDECAEEQETRPYGRYCEMCGCDTFTERHKEGCGKGKKDVMKKPNRKLVAFYCARCRKQLGWAEPNDYNLCFCGYCMNCAKRE
jgi:hypothetical protein